MNRSNKLEAIGGVVVAFLLCLPAFIAITTLTGCPQPIKRDNITVNPPKFAIGDTVKLKSHSQLMTVVENNNRNIYNAAVCAKWIDTYGALQTGYFPEDALIKVEK